MEYVIAGTWFVAGLLIGVVGTIGYVMYIGHREIKKRGKRSADWQKVKKVLDKENIKEWGI